MAALAQGPLMPLRTRPNRITVDLDDDIYHWLTQARFTDRLTTSDRVRALLELNREDPELTARVLEKSAQLARERADQG